MTLIKENFFPTLIILVASAIVILAALPAANSEWAEGIRNNSRDQREGQQFEEGEGGEGGEGREAAEGRGRPSGVFMIVAPLIKVTILMGIGGLLTALVLWIIRVSGGRKRVPQGGG